MIDKLTLKNFQSHKNTQLTFHPGVNIIVGSTDSGKSAIMRALRWVATNKPLGEGVRSWWGGDTEVEVCIDENKITRKRADDFNGYILNEGEFAANGVNVPAEVLKAFNINDVNLQRQLDAPFLLSESPGEVATHFNKVARLDQIDTGIQNIQKWINSLNSVIGVAQYKGKPATGLIGQIEETELKLTQYDNLEDGELLLSAIETKQTKEEDLYRSLFGLQRVKEAIKGVEESIAKYDDILALSEKVDLLQNKIKANKEQQNKVNDLLVLINSIQRCSVKIKDNSIYTDHENRIIEIQYQIQTKNDKQGKYTTLIKIVKESKENRLKIENINKTLQLENNVNDISLKFENIRTLKVNSNSLNLILEKIQKSSTDLQLEIKKYNILKKEWDVNFPDVCPLCGK